MMRTRFAPSPTGYLHIGGVRTALFNWLLARGSGGRFVLRIDDTDAGRNVDAALQPILDGFRWLGIEWDEGPEVGGPHAPYFQSQRAAAHRAAVERLLASGHAYRDYARPEELQQLRQQAERDKVAFVYDRRWMAQSDAQAAGWEAEGRSAVVRLKMPRSGQCVIDDLVRGDVRVDWASEQDHVIQRSDGSCLYHLASVVDDHDLQITHVVRAEEHLPNTPRQIFILEALGYSRPVYAHLPYVAQPGGSAKLSKRKLKQYLKHQDFADLVELGQRIARRCGLQVELETFNPVLVDFYRQIGFLPEAMLNYLLLLGWALDGQRERFSVQEMTQQFSLQRVTRSPASFDPRKLLAFQAERMAELPLQRRVELVRPFAERAGWLTAADAEQRLTAVVAAAGQRIRVAGEILDFDYCFVADDAYEYDQKAFQKRIVRPDHAGDLLHRFAQRLDLVTPWDANETEAALKQFCDDQGIGIGQIIHALRVAVTGQAIGFGMFETLQILGKEAVKRRIARTIAVASANAGDSG